MSAEIKKLIADFGKIPLDMRKEIRTAAKSAAKPVMAESKRLSGWSSRIPRATRIKMGFAKSSAGVAIIVSAKKAPHARPYENGGRAGTFRHPLFGNRERWFAQEARPFLAPAARGKIEAVKDEFRKAVIDVAHKNGFH